MKKTGPFALVTRSPLVSGEELERALEKAVMTLASWTGVRRIWLFGSAARGERLDWRSDLDFAVEGLPQENLERAWAALEEAVRLPVDVVRLEAASPALRDEILRDGRVLYEN